MNTDNTSETTKKKPRNRKLQRYARKLRKQGENESNIENYKRANKQQAQEQMHEEEIDEIIPLNDAMETTNDSMSPQALRGPSAPRRKENKRKRPASAKQDDETRVARTFSQISFEEKSTKKKRTTATTSSPLPSPAPVETNPEEKGEAHETIFHSDINGQATSFHSYLAAPKRKFKRMLKTALVGEQDTIQWCNSKERLNYVHAHTRLVDKVNYLRLEQDLWESHALYGQTYHCWTSPLSGAILRQHLLTSDYQQSEKTMKKYQKKLCEQLHEAEQAVQLHASLLKDYQRDDSIVDEQRLWATILALVRKNQHKLSQHYTHRKRLLKNNAKDHHLVNTCLACQPTETEIGFMQRIWQVTIQKYQSQEKVDVLKQHIHVKRLPKSLDYLDQSFKAIENELSLPVYDQNTRTTLASRHRKVIAQNKCDLMAFHISMAEAAVRGYRQEVDKEKKNLLDHMQQDPLRQSIAKQFIGAIEERQKLIQQHIQYLTKRRLAFFYRRSDDRRVQWHRRSYRLHSSWDILPTSSIIEVFSKLTCEQLALLARGPKYVPPCQSRFYTKEKREKIIQQEQQTMVEKIQEFFREHRYCISEKRIKEFSIDLKALLQRLYTAKLSQKLYVRAKREHKLCMRIRRYLHQCQRVILRRTDKSKVFHLGHARDYRAKILQYMQETSAYEEITSGISPLAAQLRQVTSLLDRLHKTARPLITKRQYALMYPKQDHIELGHVYFIPKPHKIGTPLRPIVACMNGPATKISKFLDDQLRPLFNQVAHKTTCINGTDIVQQLEQYQKQGRLSSTTKFITSDVKNLYTMIPREGALDALGRFCSKHAKNGRIGNLTVDTILRLARVVLDTNCFVFDGKYYRQIRGGAMGSPFTMVLANIYMYEWEQLLIQHQHDGKEIYVRYIDDIFMTSNESTEKIRELLDREGAKNPNIQINYTIHESVEFLDVLVENIQGELKTSVFRKPAAEPYILPYLSDHPRHLHSNTIHTALLRAIRLCSDMTIFDRERLSIEIALLLNGYPPTFISYHFKQFFRKHDASSVYKDLDAVAYQKLHDELLASSKQLTPSCDQLEQQQQQPEAAKETGEKTKKQKQLIIHYRFENGPLLKFKCEFRKLWKKHFCYEKSPLDAVRLILGTRTNQSLERLLVQKKPSRALLRKMEDTSVPTIAMETA